MERTARRSLLLLASFLLSAAPACDTAPDPVGSSNSPFLDEIDIDRSIGGRVFSGTEAVVGARVRLDAAPYFVDDQRLQAKNDPSWNATTDANGSYSWVQAPFRYDVSIVNGRELVVFRDLGFRYFEPSIGEEATVRAFRSRVRVLVREALPFHTLAFLASGPDVTSFTVDPARGEGDLGIRRFTSKATLWAFEYPVAKGLGTITSWGKVDVEVTPENLVDVPITLAPAPPSLPITFVATAPEGFVPEPVEVVMDCGVPTTTMPVVKVAPGGTVYLTKIDGVRWHSRLRAKRADGAVTWSPTLDIDPNIPKATFEMYEPAELLEAPSSATGTLRARGAGVHEHVFVPAAGGSGASLRIVGPEGILGLPDATRFGLPVPRGKYTWTVRRWPKVELPEHLGGPESRRYAANAELPPREIVFP